MSDPFEEELREGEDFYMEDGAMVFTAAYHTRRGYCCGSGCRHCPYADWSAPAKPPKADPRQK